MAGDDVQEVAVADPEEGLQREELGAGFAEQGFLVVGGAEGGDPGSGLLVAQEAPEGAALGGGDGAVRPGCVCVRGGVSRCFF